MHFHLSLLPLLILTTSAQISDSNPALSALTTILSGKTVPSTPQSLLLSIQSITTAANTLTHETDSLPITAPAPAAKPWLTANTALISALESAANNATNLPAPLTQDESGTIFGGLVDMVDAVGGSMESYVAKGEMGVYNGGKIDFLVRIKVGVAKFGEAVGEKIPVGDGGRYKREVDALGGSVDGAIKAWKAVGEEEG